MSTASTIRRLAIAMALAVLALASLAVPRAANAAVWHSCTQPTVSGPVRAADGRVYVRGHTTGCSDTYRIKIMLKKNGAVVASNTQYYWSGGGGAGVFSHGACTRGAVYQGVALVSSYWDSAWHDMISGTSGSPDVMC